MPDVQEVFRTATQKVRPEQGFVDRQLDRQRRRVRNRRMAAITVVAAIALVAAILIDRELPGDRTQPATPGHTNGSSAPQVSTPPGGAGLTTDVPFAPFRSTVYPYSMGYPEVWSVRPARRSLTPLGLPMQSLPGTDTFGAKVAPSAEDYPVLIVGASPVEPGTTPRAWTSEVETAVDQCGPPTTTETVTVDGERATLSYFVGCYYSGSKGTYKYWTTFVHGGMGYHLIWIGNTGDEARDRSVLDRILETFRFTD